MLFNSYIFVFAFLPLLLVGWFGCNYFKKYKFAQIFVVVMSLWFYGYFEYHYLLIIIGSVLSNWLLSASMERFEKARNIIGIAGVVLNLSVLFYFKYYDFFIENINLLFKTEWNLKNIILPLGISFFTFQQISFIIDRKRGTASHYHFLDYMMFVVYFPQLIAGPIVSHDTLIPQFWETEKRKWNWINVLQGTRLFTIGMAKKVLLADELGKIVTYGFAYLNTLDTLGSLVTMLAYTFQIFFDFSGYSDMASGLALMMNFELPLNFDSPYKSHSVKEFWNRWHITLGTFLTKYVYIPLGGNRAGKIKQMRNTMIVFLLSGIWHGANWTFVLWGIAHGAAVCADNLIDPLLKKVQNNKSKLYVWMDKLRWVCAFSFVNLAWVLFRSDSITQAQVFYKHLFSFTNTGTIFGVARSLQGYKNYLLKIIFYNFGGETMELKLLYPAWLLMVLAVAAFLCTRSNAREWVRKHKPTIYGMVVMAIVFGLCVLEFSSVATFLYFDF